MSGVFERHRVSERSLSDFPEFLAALLAVKKAAALANRRELGAKSGRIVRAVARLERNPPRRIPVDPWSGGGAILINRWVNEALAGAAGVEAKADANLSQSTADVVATAHRVALFRLASALSRETAESARILRARAKKMRVPHPARTCLQDAMPSRLDRQILAYAAFLDRRARRLASSAKELLRVNLGGTVIGSGEGASARYRKAVVPALARLTGLPLRRRANLFDAAQNSDDLFDLAQELETLSVGSIKIGKDLRLLASGPDHGFGEIELPKIVEGSSFFSNKNNPTVVETWLQGCFSALGAVRAVQAALEHAELELNVFEPTAAFELAAALKTSARSFSIMNRDCLRQIRAR